MNKPATVLACAMAVLGTRPTCVRAQTALHSSALQAPAHMQGHAPPYIAARDMPDMTAILPVPPPAGSAANASDLAIFQSTRALIGTPRGALAVHDAKLDAQTLVGDFDCAIGATLTPANVPALFTILDRSKEDASAAYQATKNAYGRKRPFIGNDAPICVPRDARLADSGSYPSGHATIGEGLALILAELAPDRATAILSRGRVFAESRVVCGVHWATDVEAGLVTGATLVATLHGVADFRRDMDQARLQIASARNASPAPDPATCQAEGDAERHSIMFTPGPPRP